MTKINFGLLSIVFVFITLILGILGIVGGHNPYWSRWWQPTFTISIIAGSLFGIVGFAKGKEDAKQVLFPYPFIYY